jgi:hypothetical protein
MTAVAAAFDGHDRGLRGLDGSDEAEHLAQLLHARDLGVESEEGVVGAEKGVARSYDHADELVASGRVGPQGLAELTALAHAHDLRARVEKGQLFANLASR